MPLARPALKAAAAAAALALALAVAAAWLFWPGGEVEVVVPAGQSARATAAMLKERGVVRSALMFRAAARLGGLERRLRPGTYRLRQRMLPGRLLAALAAGSGGVKVVIPEGWTARQVAERLEKSGLCPAADFMRLAANERLEGYLFPTTYFFEPGTDAAHVSARMRAEFDRRLGSEFARTASKPGLTMHQVLTLASIVEREAVLASEQPMVAAVYLNRMRIRMRLQADPTVQYALGYWKKGLSLEDLRNPSSYNTYVHYGLPPGPICNPGLGAFRAVLHPAPSDALFFVADLTGGHRFFAKQEDHLKAKLAYKRGLREEKKRLRSSGAQP
ncbi:MAG: endolytic transglycosylase MltG [Elusimicrobia bacterium]|nr:endolytic transglycosylase MltG [Elusimicrobiota bacterium]